MNFEDFSDMCPTKQMLFLTALGSFHRKWLDKNNICLVGPMSQKSSKIIPQKNSSKKAELNFNI